MAHTLFISDLHLSAQQVQVTDIFLRFMQEQAPQAEALYLLGDLFEYWAGDDDLDEPYHQRIVQALHRLSTGGTPVYLLHGNRDLLMGKGMEQASGAKLLADPTLLNLYGTPTLISHGDALCTDDIAYQNFRTQVRDADWQRAFLARPLAERKTYIEQLRARSEDEKKNKRMEIMDVNADAVAALLRAHGYVRLIHGHTHRLNRHVHEVDGHVCERWVLGDWHGTGNALRCDAQGCTWVTLT